jgi:hypothetical protein
MADEFVVVMTIQGNNPDSAELHVQTKGFGSEYEADQYVTELFNGGGLVRNTTMAVYRLVSEETY